MSLSTLTELAVDLVPCDYCKAPPGTFCRVASGRTAGVRASYVHTGRMTVIYATWRVGYTEGLLEAVDRVERALARGEEFDVALGQLRRWAS